MPLLSIIRRCFGKRHAPVRFQSPEPIPHRSHWRVLRWMLFRRPSPYPEVSVNRDVPCLDNGVEPGHWKVTLVNHATFLIRLHGLNLLTDPVWSERVSPLKWAGPKRKRPPGIPWEQLPTVDVVLISHDHYDHFDATTLQRLEERFHPLFLVPLGMKPLLMRHCGPHIRTQELDWWEAANLPTGGGAHVTVSLTPAKHYSGRSPFHGDANQSLWGGFFIRDQDGPGIYFAGDTAWTHAFQDIRARLGAPDLALLSIGAYKPEDFIATVHLTPGEAVQAFKALDAQQGMACHFGTWQLADDGYQEALDDFHAALKDADIDESRFIARDNGFTLLSANMAAHEAS